MATPANEQDNPRVCRSTHFEEIDSATTCNNCFHNDLVEFHLELCRLCKEKCRRRLFELRVHNAATRAASYRSLLDRLLRLA